jgi:hypothetical protein
MEILRRILFFICACAVVGCAGNQDQPKEDSLSLKSKEESSFAQLHDSLQFWLGEATVKDSVEYSSWSRDNFLFIKSGRVICDSLRNAVVIYSSTDSTVRVDLYELSDNAYSKKNKVIELPGPTVAFNVVFEDYNFDGYNDLFIQQSCSNGITMRLGHVLIYEPLASAGEFRIHHEFDSIRNPRPGPDRKMVVGDSIIWCKAMKSLCMIQYEWRGANLWRKSAECPCKGDD